MKNTIVNYTVPNLEKGLAVLEYLSQSVKGKTLQEIKDDLEISQTTAYRILNAMTRLDYLIYNEDTKHYKLSRKLLTLGFRSFNPTKKTKPVADTNTAVSGRISQGSCEGRGR